MRSHNVSGGGGIKLHVSDQGRKDAPAILFIHGWAQHTICWHGQAPLADNFRVVALDLRGHGSSEAPQNESAYTDTRLWADDINAVITELGLKNVVLVGWSYGARVIASYLGAFGQGAVAGIVLAGGIIAIGKHREPWMVGEGSPGRNPDLYTTEQSSLIQATTRFVDQCTYTPLPRETFGEFVGANMLVSPLVRRALFAGHLDCRPVWQRFTKPALIIHGANDAVVEPIVGKAAHEALPNSTLQLWDKTGHAPFAEYPKRFNAELAAFATQACQEVV